MSVASSNRISRDAALAAGLLAQGGLVAIPTETVYGLAARADDARAVARIFAAKGRPRFDPLIAHFPGAAEAARWVSFDRRADRAAERLWPGPLTLVLPRLHGLDGPLIPDLVTSGLDTAAVRVPAHPAALDVLRLCGFPLAAPSANPFGYVSPTTAQHVVEGLGDRVDLVLDGGECRVGVESTILDLSGDRPRLLRPGGVPVEAIEDALGERLPAYQGFAVPEGLPAQAPGMLRSHYAPRIPVGLYEQADELLAAARDLGPDCAVVAALRDPRIGVASWEDLGEDDVSMATRLFAALRRVETSGATRVLALLPSPQGLGLAVRDRLIRAGGGRQGGDAGPAGAG